MQKRISLSMMLIAFISIISIALFFSLQSYNSSSRQLETGIQNQAWFLEKSLSHATNAADYLAMLGLSADQCQITLIDRVGKALFDNSNSGAQVNNYLDYHAVKKAIEIGQGGEIRPSATLGTETYYFAFQLKDGNILLLSKPQASIFGVFNKNLLFLIIAFLFLIFLAALISKRLTQKLVAPINQIDLTNDDYDKNLYEELTPFIRAMAKQKEQIGNQWLDMESRANTIKAITDGMQEGLILLDQDEKILSANSSALRFCSSSEHDCTGHNVLLLIRNVELLQCVRLAIKGEPGTLLMEIGAQSVQVFVNPIKHKDIIKGAIILFMDITAQAKAEKIRKEFSANVSHELKTPLTTILGYAELIHAGMAEEEDILRFAGKIEIEVNRLISLIEAIINLAELDENNNIKQKEDFDLNALLAVVIERIKPLAAEKSVKIIADNPHMPVHANRSMMEELFFNLIENAVKYNKFGGEVEVKLEEVERKIQISVSDSGMGIPAEHHDRIFERFYRADPSRSKKTGGFGLGLSIVKHIVNYHQGTVEINSEEGKGTQVKVTLG